VGDMAGEGTGLISVSRGHMGEMQCCWQTHFALEQPRPLPPHVKMVGPISVTAPKPLPPDLQVPSFPFSPPFPAAHTGAQYYSKEHKTNHVLKDGGTCDNGNSV
jgi:hypothetical protein